MKTVLKLISTCMGICAALAIGWLVILGVKKLFALLLALFEACGV
jgi:hypothetical protein